MSKMSTTDRCPVAGIGGYDHLFTGEPTTDGDVAKHARCLYCGERKLLSPSEREAMRDWLAELYKRLDEAKEQESA